MTRKTPAEPAKNAMDRKPGSRKDDLPQHPEQSRPEPGQDNDPKRGGYHHADTAMGTRHSEAISQVEQTITGPDNSHPADGESGGDPAEKDGR